MEPDEHKDVYRRAIAAVSEDDDAALRACLAPDVIDHNPLPDQAPGIDGFKQWIATVRSSFPDFQGTVQIMLAEEDLVAGHVLWRGTHRGIFLGIPASGAPIEIPAFHVVRFAGGRIVEWWGTADLLGALEQMGAHVVPGGASRDQ